MTLFPGLDAAFLQVLDTFIAGDPMRQGVLWTNLSLRDIAADSLASWWETYGKAAYPEATSILLLCDGGGSNAANRYVFKYAIQELAGRIGVEIRVAHYPPYCSKYNPIEHRMFPHVTKACQGIVFYSTEMVVKAMSRAGTRAGLKTTVHVLPGDYPTGEKAPPGYKETMGILFDAELPKWNYRAIPTKPGS